METKEIKFNKEKLTASIVFPEEAVLTMGRQGEDFIRDQFTAQIETFIAARINEEQTINVYHKRPTFWEWITRKHITINVKIQCKEVLKNPPAIKGRTILMYSVEQSDE